MRNSVFPHGAAGVQTVPNATIVPFGQGNARGVQRAAGVFDAEAGYVSAAQCFRSEDLPITIEPEAEPEPDSLGRMHGRWLFGGMLYQHFGHFLVESTSRLWALDHVKEPIDGVVYFPRKALKWPKRYVHSIQQWFDAFGPDIPRVVAPIKSMRVDALVIAPQGFGLGAMAAGLPEYRDFVRRRLHADQAAEGAEKIYISRDELFFKRGRYLGEARIGRLLEAEGYRIYHPQRHSLAEQVAQYKAAKVIVSSDASALHLAGFFAASDTRVAIIRRRDRPTYKVFETQFTHFTGRRPDVVSVFRDGIYVPDDGGTTQMSEVYTLLDHAALGRSLFDLGYIHDPSPWHEQAQEDIEAELAALAESFGVPMVQLT